MVSQKRYWLRGGVTGLILSLPVVYLSPTLLCPDFYRIGPANPTNQPFCSFLLGLGSHHPFPWVVFDWFPIFFLFAIVGIILGWFYGKIKNRKLQVIS